MWHLPRAKKGVILDPFKLYKHRFTCCAHMHILHAYKLFQGGDKDKVSRNRRGKPTVARCT